MRQECCRALINLEVMARTVTNGGFCAIKWSYRRKLNKHRKKALTEKEWEVALDLVPQINQDHWHAARRKKHLKANPLAGKRDGAVGGKKVWVPPPCCRGWSPPF